MKTFYEGHDKAYQNRKASGAQGWDNSEKGYAEFEAEVKSMLSKGNAPLSGKLLELGCGAGNMTVWLSGLGYDTYGIDIAPTAIEWARERAEKLGVAVSLTLGNVIELAEFKDSFFDFVFDSHCLHCIIGPDRLKLLKSIHRVLKPNGYLLINTMCGPVKIDEFHKLDNANTFDPASKCAVSKSGISSRYFGDPEDIFQELKTSGFELLSHEIKTEENGIIHYLLADARKK
ncbi:MAG: class I SAM-dependent methyltransferase [Candidatus Wallbacteria bacterium]|nr:class I SAM-dependent methyltransferase [Candidatus Wallbacteria bacterium]